MPPFKDRETGRVYRAEYVKRYSGIARQAEKRLRMVVQARRLTDLLAIPGCRLEQLKGNRAGQYSVRVNDPNSVWFEWADGQAINIELTDYHD